ncbi:hypothetical protein WOLCODRAFT_140392 [Wolfiporia cocos MD-104 SS10]|uniref:Uncharacterized protein n=1 Tax=Wolfiporia cocos (strain MD-104) TaxID=742152 RepID=A0A2H3J2J4_WOLCO|nr:hypothetical protein WOLCODRAFT_140392 [Wolfiporia cocos MD-104 SS10]
MVAYLHVPSASLRMLTLRHRCAREHRRERAKLIFNHQWYAVSEHARSAASGSEGSAMEWSWRADFALLSRRLECWTEGTFHRDSPIVYTSPQNYHLRKAPSKRSHTVCICAKANPYDYTATMMFIPVAI